MKLESKFSREDKRLGNRYISTIIYFAQSQLFSVEPKQRAAISSDDYKYFKLKEKLNSFYNIKDNWDGEGSAGINEEAINISHQILNHIKGAEFVENRISIFVFPTLESGVQFELDSDNLKADIEILPNENIELYIYSIEGDIIYNRQFDINSLNLLISSLEEKIFNYA